jgi:uncharacterized membrane protein YhdT
MKNSSYYLWLSLLFVVIFIICCYLYGYNSGSCKMKKKYICNNDFCLYKEFNVFLQDIVKNEIKYLIANKKIQKRVNIETFPETFFN